MQRCSAWFVTICLEAQSGLLGIETAELHLDGPCGQGMENLLLGGGLVISRFGIWKMQNIYEKIPRAVGFFSTDFDFLFCMIPDLCVFSLDLLYFVHVKMLKWSRIHCF